MVGFFTDGLDSAGSGLGVLLVPPDVGTEDLSGGTDGEEATAGDGFEDALSPAQCCVHVMDTYPFWFKEKITDL